MSYSKKDIEKMNQVYRESLKPDWTSLEIEQTDKGQKKPKPSVCKQYQEGQIYELKKDIKALSKQTVPEVILKRRSVRQYAQHEMSVMELSYLLRLTASIKDFGPGYAFGVVPTGGATSSLETYVYLNHVKDMPKGLYHFMKDTNNIRLIDPNATAEVVNEALKNQLRDANIAIFWTATPYRTEYKYQYLSHKMIAMEAGHACQNLYLASESIDYGVVAIAAYHQKKADALLKLDDKEFVIYCATVGKKKITD